MTVSTLSPLNTCINLPITLTYATEKPLKVAETNRSKSATPEDIESWLQTLEAQFPDGQVRVLVRTHPAGDSGIQPEDLDRQALHHCLEQATVALGKTFPCRKRAFYDAVFRIERQGSNITCKSSIEPRIQTGPGARLMKRLDLAPGKEEANRILLQFWTERLSWLRNSGIESLESRSNLNPLLWD